MLVSHLKRWLFKSDHHAKNYYDLVDLAYRFLNESLYSLKYLDKWTSGNKTSSSFKV